MKKKLFLKKTEFSNSFLNVDACMHSHLNALRDVLNGTDLGDFHWIKIEEENDIVIIYDDGEFKPLTEELDKNYFKPKYAEISKQYHEYYLKRFFCAPKVVITKENYEQLQQQWKKLHRNQVNFLIITEDKNGICIEGKDKLSEQDQLDLEKETKRYELFVKLHKEHWEIWGKYSREWRSPADDEYCFKEDWLPCIEYP